MKDIVPFAEAVAVAMKQFDECQCEIHGWAYRAARAKFAEQLYIRGAVSFATALPLWDSFIWIEMVDFGRDFLVQSDNIRTAGPELGFSPYSLWYTRTPN